MSYSCNLSCSRCCYCCSCRCCCWGRGGVGDSHFQSHHYAYRGLQETGVGQAWYRSQKRKCVRCGPSPPHGCGHALGSHSHPIPLSNHLIPYSNPMPAAVTETDKASEEAVVAAIRAAFPNHAVLGEEGGVLGDVSSDYLWWVLGLEA